MIKPKFEQASMYTVACKNILLHIPCMPMVPAGVYQGQLKSKDNLDQAKFEITYTITTHIPGTEKSSRVLLS